MGLGVGLGVGVGFVVRSAASWPVSSMASPSGYLAPGSAWAPLSHATTSHAWSGLGLGLALRLGLGVGVDDLARLAAQCLAQVVAQRAAARAHLQDDHRVLAVAVLLALVLLRFECRGRLQRG